MHNNPDCCGSGPHSADLQVRVLPLTGGANLILCRTCYAREIRYRVRRNAELAADARYDLPAWEKLKIYKGA